MIYHRGLHASLHLGFPPFISVGLRTFPLVRREYLHELERYKEDLQTELGWVEKEIEKLKQGKQ
jgi:hypothetical protein